MIEENHYTYRIAPSFPGTWYLRCKPCRILKSLLKKTNTVGPNMVRVTTGIAGHGINGLDAVYFITRAV